MPEKLEERLRFYARQIKIRRASLLYSSPELTAKVREMEEDYRTAHLHPLQLFRALLQSSPRQLFQSAAAVQPTSGLQSSAAAKQPTPGLQHFAADEQPTPSLQSFAAAEQPTPGLQ
ncbi:hypothetical protein AMECASPLE_022702 [Ameca splendens]|uniref:Uncharacterized protein n=1 Tax=Ameca splendens TaxID=208324 RepID=A0ABV0ZD38_9TELE